MKRFAQRIDDILIDSKSRTEENPEGDWSSTRFFLFISLVTFLGISIEDAAFRDAGAFTAIILTLIGAVAAPKLLDLRVAIGNAAAAIGRKFSRTEETVTTVQSEGGGAPGDVEIEAENVTVTENAADSVDPPPMGADPAKEDG